MADAILVLLSGRDRSALLAAIDRVIAGGDLDDVRAGDPERLGIVAPPELLAERLRHARTRLAAFDRTRLSLRDRGMYFGAGESPGRVAFLFPGEGAQRAGMMRTARDRLAPVRDWFDALDRAYTDNGDPRPSDLLTTTNIGNGLFDIAQGGQLCTIANLALFEVLESVGVAPDVMLGHSNGEHAAILAGRGSPVRDRQRIVGWLREASLAGRNLPPPGAPEATAAVSMLEVATLEAILAPILGVFVAMDNCPTQQVIAGARSAIEAAAAAIAEAGGMCRPLPFARAYHTPLFADWGALLGRHYADLPLERTRVPVVSCLTGEPLPEERTALHRAMARQWTAPLSLRTAIARLYGQGVRTFVEVGADSKLSHFVGDILRGRPHLAAPCAVSGQDDLLQLQRLFAMLHAQGLAIDSARWRRLMAPKRAPAASGTIAAQRALIGSARASLARIDRLFAERHDRPGGKRVAARRLDLATAPWLGDHSFARPPARPLPIVSMTASIALAAAAARRHAGRAGPLTLTGLRAETWLALDGGSLDVAIETETVAAGVRVAITGPERQEGFRADVAIGDPVMLDLPARIGRTPRRWSADAFYRDYAFHGPAFRGLRGITAIGADFVTANLCVTTLPGIAADAREADPALLDCVGQLAALWLLEEAGLPPSIGAFPFDARRIVLHGPPPPAGTMVECRLAIRRHNGAWIETDALLTAGGRPIASVEGLRQRIVHLPPAIAGALLGGCGRLTGGRLTYLSIGDHAQWAAAIADQGGIWARLLAHLTLGDGDFAVWQANRDVEWLLARLNRQVAGGIAA